MEFGMIKFFSRWNRDQRGDNQAPPSVILYTRQHCQLCDEAKDQLKRLQREEPFQLVEVDIDTDPQLCAQFNDDVPVIFIHGRKAFKHRIEGRTFLKSLRAGPSAECT
jgi:glutaredoxin